MERFVEAMLQVWWRYDSAAHWTAQPYHVLNLLEGVAWLAIAAYVAQRQWRRPHTRIAWFYAAAFVAFGLTDFYEAWIVQPWLIALKGMILAAILLLRRRVLKALPKGARF